MQRMRSCSPRRRPAYPPTSNAASHDNHKIFSWVSFSFLCGYGLRLAAQQAVGAPLRNVRRTPWSQCMLERVFASRAREKMTHFISLNQFSFSKLWHQQRLANGLQRTRGVFPWPRSALGLCCLDQSDFQHQKLNYISCVWPFRAPNVLMTYGLYYHQAESNTRHFKTTLKC